MRIWIAAAALVLAFAVLMGGCLQGTSAPDKVQPTTQNGGTPPAQEYVPTEQMPENVAVTPPAETKPQDGVMEQPPALPTPCSNFEGSQKVDCAIGLARSGKDVTQCEILPPSDERFKCITNWCMSEARDFTQCDKLAESNDKLACKNKCNPNPNT